MAPTTKSHSKEGIEKKKERKKKTNKNSIDDGEKSNVVTSNLAEEKNKNRAKWAKKCHGLVCKEVSKEFNDKMKRFVPPTVTMKLCLIEKNDLKCRYADVKCIDQTRVVLQDRPKDDDFIHANWVGAPGGTKYICTQGPLPNSIDDFWWMCLKEKVSIILMLCNFKEGSDLEKCAHYFPEKFNDKVTYGDVSVTRTEKIDDIEIEDTDFTTMELKYIDTKHKIKHCYMRYWVDNCAPVETQPILKLWRWVRKHHNDAPVVVHCSAGVGRTSTFVGIELADYRIARSPDVSLLDIVKELRSQRYQSIQSHVQFLYLHYLLIDYWVQEKFIEPYKESKFIEEYRKHTAKRTVRAKKQAAGQGRKKDSDDAAGGEKSKKPPVDSDADGL